VRRDRQTKNPLHYVKLNIAANFCRSANVSQRLLIIEKLSFRAASDGLHIPTVVTQDEVFSPKEKLNQLCLSGDRITFQVAQQAQPAQKL
jgi:hypothetical protein